ncbi:MAG: hypothetical protein JWO24_2088 [Rhodospirillales bacterium]|jgi:hypothetical protein|nr:hypothetical protein [Rhodospirillales bacterium]
MAGSGESMNGPISQTGAPHSGRRELLALAGATILAAPAAARTLAPFGGAAFQHALEATASATR